MQSIGQYPPMMTDLREISAAEHREIGQVSIKPPTESIDCGGARHFTFFQAPHTIAYHGEYSFANPCNSGTADTDTVLIRFFLMPVSVYAATRYSINPAPLG